MIFLTSKHPDATPWFIVDWADYISSIGAASISTSVWTEVSTTGLTIENDAIDEFKTRARIIGGTDGAKHYLENKVTFSDSSSDIVSFTVVVADGVPD